LLLAALAAVGRAADTSAKAETCGGDFGTSVQFEKSPSKAAQKALAEEKLVVVLHVSGNFEESEFT
jgi:hypothetical protein